MYIILSESTPNLDKTLSHLIIISSNKIIEWDKVNLSADEFARSLSCHSNAFSYDGIIIERTILAKPQAFSAVIGFFLCAIVEDPTCFSASKYSPTSAISLL